jgi:hypothetical protein
VTRGRWSYSRAYSHRRFRWLGIFTRGGVGGAPGLAVILRASREQGRDFELGLAHVIESSPRSCRRRLQEATQGVLEFQWLQRNSLFIGHGRNPSRPLAVGKAYLVLNRQVLRHWRMNKYMRESFRYFLRIGQVSFSVLS